MIILLKFFLRVFLILLVLAFGFSFVFNRWIEPDVTGDQHTLAGEGNFQPVGDAEYHFESWGQGVKTYVLLHGFGSSSATWRALAQSLAVNARVIAIDEAGFGYSSRGAGIDYRTEARIDRLEKFLDAQQITEATLIGNSYGGTLALAFAETHPERVDKLIVISPALFRNSFSPPAFLLKIPEISKAAIKLMFSEKRLTQQYKQQFADPNNATENGVTAFLAPYKVAGTFDSLMTMATQKDLKKYDHTNITAPTLIIWGEQDTTVPRQDMDVLKADMFNAHLAVLEDTGHLAQEESPQTVLSQIVQFENDPKRLNP